MKPRSKKLRIAGILGILALLAVVVLAVQNFRPDRKVATATDQGGPSPEVSFGVNAIGASSFDIPLELAPGTNDMAPDLALNYNSSGGNNLMGMGWQLSGLSAVSRAPATIAVDGFSGTIAYNQNDRFALDGQRLIAVKGAYGAEGTFYHTQMESWTRLQAHGQAGQGPRYFTATTKEGFTASYGETDDARIMAVNEDGAATWALNRLTDLNGNSIRFTYLQNPNTGQYLPDSILYTEHGNEKALRAVTFTYEARGDSLPGYGGGSLVKNTRRLQRVRTLVNGSLVREYTFAYTESEVTGRSRLISIRTCNGNGACARDLLLGWQIGGTGFSNQENYQSTTPIQEGLPTYPEGFLDVNGDGKGDFARFVREDGRNYLSVVLARTDRFVDGEFKSEVEPGNSSLPFSFSDVNGDGRADYARFLGVDRLSVALATKGGFLDGQYASTVTTGDLELPFTYADVNGDGRTDYLRFIQYDGKSMLSAALAGSSGFETGVFSSEVDPGVEGLPRAFADVNGDNRSDYIRFIEDQGKYYLSAALADTNGFIDGDYRIEADTGLYDLPRSFSDINGDGRVDYVRYTEDRGTQTLTAVLSTGTGFSPVPFTSNNTVTTPANPSFPYSFVDVNGDGFQDFVRLINSTGKPTLSAALVQPNGFGNQDFNSPSWVDPGVPTLPSSFVDVNGDGRADFVRFLRKSGGYFLTAVLAGGDYPGLMTSLDNQKGQQFEVDYLPITNDTVYTRMDTLTYPYKEFQVPYYVVKSYDAVEYAMEDRHVEFRFAAAAMDVTGRGFLGFGHRKQIDAKSDVSSEMYVQQRFPYAGMIDSIVSRRVSDQALLNTTNYTYSSLQPYPDCWLVLRDTARSGMYSEGTYGFTTLTWSRFDGFGNVIAEGKLGDLANLQDDQYTSYDYFNDTTGTWRIGYQQNSKRGNQLDLDFAQYYPQKDLVWEQVEYEPVTFNIRSVKKWDEDHQSWVGNEFAYDTYGNVVRNTDPLATSRITYDAIYHTFIASTTVPVRAGDSLITLTEYDPRFGTLTQQTDPNGKNMVFCLDGWGRIADTYGPAPSGNSSSKDNCAGLDLIHLIRNSYMETDSGTLTEVRSRHDWADADVNTWYWQRSYTNSSGKDYRKTSRGAEGKMKIETERYNGTGKPLVSTLPYFEGETPISSTVTYDASGLIRNIVTANSTTTFTYEGGGQTVHRTEAAGTELAATTTFTVNLDGQTLTMLAPDQGLTRYHYDAMGRLDSVIDPNGIVNVTRYTSLGPKAMVKDPDIGVRRFTYAANGLLASETDALGQVTSFTYDLMARMTQRSIEGTAGTLVNDFVYDGNANPAANARGHLYQVRQSWNGQTGPAIDYHYDAYGNPIATTVTPDAAGPAYTMGSSFSPVGQLQHAVYPDNSRLTVTRDAGSNLFRLDLENASNGVRSPAKAIATFTRYTAQDQVGEISFSNGVVSTMTYDPVIGNLSEKRTLSAHGDTLMHNRLQWDARQFIRQIEDLRQNSAVPNTSQTFWYSTTGRLDSASAPGTYGQARYLYNAGGDILEKSGIVYSDFSGHRALRGTRDGEEVFAATYDANGNLSSKVMDGVTWTYAYDGANRLLEVQRDGQLVTSYTYNYLGTRLSKTEAASGTTTWYLFPGFEQVSGPDRATQFTKYIDGEAGHVAAITQPDSLTDLVSLAALTPGTDAWQAQLTGPQTQNRVFALVLDYFEVNRTLLLAVTALVLLLCLWLIWLQISTGQRRQKRLRLSARLAIPLMVFTQALVPMYATAGPTALSEAAHQAATTPAPGIPELGEQFFHQDHLGSTALVTDHAGNLQSTAVYKPYGEYDRAHSFGPNDFRAKFTGKELDEGTELYYFAARYFDPVLGTFITADTEMGGDANTIDALNRYAYALNNPIIYTDPSGHSATVWAVLGIIAFSAAVSGLAAAGTTLATQWIENGFSSIDWGQVLLAGAIGLAAGAVGAITAFGVESTLIVLAARIGVTAARATIVSVGISVATSVVSGVASTLTTNTLNALAGNEVNWISSIGFSVLSGIFTGTISGLYFREATFERIKHVAEATLYSAGFPTADVLRFHWEDVLDSKEITPFTYLFTVLGEAGSAAWTISTTAVGKWAKDNYGFSASSAPDANAKQMYNGDALLGEKNGEIADFQDAVTAELVLQGKDANEAQN